ncbi:hypothetical protein ACSS31_26860 (plasmid) [Priestia megaterium]
MNETYFLNQPNPPATQQQLAINFFTEQFRKDRSFAETFILIIDHMKKFTLTNNQITDLVYHNGEWIYSIQVQNLMGMYRPSIIIKKLNKFNHTYEMRINQTYYKHRILFCFTSYVEDSVTSEDFFILSYGFSKMDNEKDLTDDLAQSTDYIKENILLNDNEKSNINNWLGEEWNEFT